VIELPIGVGEVFSVRMLGPLKLEVNSLVGQRLKCVVVKLVDFLVGQAVHLLDGCSILVDHPLVGRPHFTVGDSHLLHLVDEGAALGTHVVVDGFIVQREDRYLLGTTRQGVIAKLGVQSSGISDVEWRSRHSCDSSSLRVGQRRARPGREKSQELRVA